MSKIILPNELILYIKRFREAHPIAKLFYDFFKHYNHNYKNIWDNPPIKGSFMNFYFSVRYYSYFCTGKEIRFDKHIIYEFKRDTSWIKGYFPQFFILYKQLKLYRKLVIYREYFFKK